jgi:hypothetical protein
MAVNGGIVHDEKFIMEKKAFCDKVHQEADDASYVPFSLPII